MGRTFFILLGFCLAVAAGVPAMAQAQQQAALAPSARAATAAPQPLMPQAAATPEAAAASDMPPGDTYGLEPLPPAAPGGNYGLKPMPAVTLPAMPRQPLAPIPAAAPQRAPLAGPARIYAAPGTGLQPDYDGAARRAAASGGGNDAYRLGPGDKVRVSVFGEDDLSGEYQVDGTGLVHLPLIGATRAAGLTAQALGRNIAAALSPGYLKNPRVNVDITTYRPFYIIGAVNRPGEYAYVDNMNVLNAVALAGGFTDKAVESVVYVRHEGSTDEQAVSTDRLSQVRPGDVIRVKTTLFWDAMDMLAPVAEPAAIAAAAVN